MHILGFLTWLSVFIGMLIGETQATERETFSRPKQHLGFADFEGKLTLWVPLSSLVLSDGSTIPFRLRFSSVPFAGQTNFGLFWRCPVMEAVAFARNERSIEFISLSGRSVYLRRSVSDRTKLVSGDGRFEGQEGSNGRLTIQGGGWVYEFFNGKIVSAKSPNGITLIWSYINGRCRSIRELGGRDLLTMDYIGQEQFPAAFTISGRKYSVKAESLPIVQDAAGQLRISALVPSLSRIEREGRTWEFDTNLSKDGLYEMRYTRKNHRPNLFKWDSKSGVLHSDGEWKYEVIPQDGMESVIRRISSSGETESYVYYSKTGTSEHRTSNGDVTTRRYFTSGGPLQYKIRHLKQVAAQGRVDEIRWSYNELGQLIRSYSGENQWIWEWHPNGNVAKEIQKKGDVILETLTYDENGRITEKIVGNKVFRYVREGGRVFVQRLVDGKVNMVVAQDESGVERAKYPISTTKTIVDIDGVESKAGELETRLRAEVLKTLKEELK